MNDKFMNAISRKKKYRKTRKCEKWRFLVSPDTLIPNLSIEENLNIHPDAYFPFLNLYFPYFFFRCPRVFDPISRALDPRDLGFVVFVGGLREREGKRGGGKK